VPDARDIGDSLAQRGIKLSLGGQVYDPTDPMGKMFFNILATFAEFEVDLLRVRTREGMAAARAKGRLRGKQPILLGGQHLGQLSALPGQRLQFLASFHDRHDHLRSRLIRRHVRADSRQVPRTTGRHPSRLRRLPHLAGRYDDGAR
jgi:DNA invertase Pin-like site-specific DNA recombinase